MRTLKGSNEVLPSHEAIKPNIKKKKEEEITRVQNTAVCLHAKFCVTDTCFDGSSDATKVNNNILHYLGIPLPMELMEICFGGAPCTSVM